MTAVAARTCLHLVSDSATQGVIVETLRRLERKEITIGMRESLGAGPLQDVDSDRALRAAWWTRILGETCSDVPDFDESDLWSRVRQGSEAVVLWHGPHPFERLFAIRACWYLRDQAERVHEVAMPARARTDLPAFYGAVGIAGPDATTKAWGRLARVQDVLPRARRWEELRNRPGEWIRVLLGEEIVQLPVTTFDDDLVRGCSGGWTTSLRIVGRMLASNPTSVAVLAWRVRELIRAGALEARGEQNEIGLPVQIRPRTPGAA
jgi:hypothetical protein